MNDHEISAIYFTTAYVQCDLLRAAKVDNKSVQTLDDKGTEVIEHIANAEEFNADIVSTKEMYSFVYSNFETTTS